MLASIGTIYSSNVNVPEDNDTQNPPSTRGEGAPATTTISPPQ